MKIQIRVNVFETNSSSTHSLTICEEGSYRDWVAGKNAFNERDNEFVKIDIDFKSIKDITSEELYEVKNNYHFESDSSYYYPWESLNSEEQQKWYDDYQVQQKYGTKFKTYYVWDEGHKWLNNRGEIEMKYTSPSGDKLIAFGYYGYDG